MVEIIINEEKSRYSFAWIKVQIVGLGVHYIANRAIDYYVVKYPPLPSSFNITVEQDQIREIPKRREPCIMKPIPKGEIVEVSTDMENQTYYFLATVIETSKATDRTVDISYRNVNIKPASMSKKIVYQSEDDGITRAFLEANRPRLISDEEHLISTKYETFKSIRSSMVQMVDANSFENQRIQICDLFNSFANARHYDKARKTLELLKSSDSHLSDFSDKNETNDIIIEKSTSDPEDNPEVNHINKKKKIDNKKDISETNEPESEQLFLFGYTL